METKNSNLSAAAALLSSVEFDEVLVACHRNPDGDAVGSAHALSYALRKMGKKARVFCADPFGSEFSYITDEEKNVPPFEPRHFVTVDVAAPEMLADAPFRERIDVVLDHHRINTVPAPLKVVLPEMASCGEIIHQVLMLMGVPTDAYLALALYTAVATDTGCFRYSNVNENTFRTAAELSRFAEEGAFYQINKKLFETKSRLRLSLEAYAVEKARFAADGRIAYLSVSREEQKRIGAAYGDLDVLINVLRQIEGVVVSLVIKERDKGEFKVSVRSEAGFDASEFCRNFGGGGHIAAAGCTLRGSEEDAVKALLSLAERSFS